MYHEVNLWIEKAQSLCATPGNGFAGLEHVSRGIGLRRVYFDRSIEFDLASAFLPTLLRLQDDTILALRNNASPESRTHIAAQLERDLSEDGKYLENLLAQSTHERLVAALALERFGGDLIWRDRLYQISSGESPPHPAFQVRVQIDDLLNLLANPAEPDFEIERSRMHSEAMDLRRHMLERRARVEADEPTDQFRPDELWRKRFLLSRMLSELESTGPDHHSDLIEQLKAKRNELSEAAFAKSSPPTTEIWDAIGTVADEGDAELTAASEIAGWDCSLLYFEHAIEDNERLATDAKRARKQAKGEIDNAIAAVARTANNRRKNLINRIQDTSLHNRQVALIGRQTFQIWENFILAMVFAILALLFVEMAFHRFGMMTESRHRTLAYADLAICSMFLIDFLFRMLLVDGKWRYFWRHALVDLFACLPFGYFAWQLNWANAEQLENVYFLRLLRLMRLQLLQPILRVGRFFLFASRLADGLMRRYMRTFNRNIVLWEPHDTDSDEDRPREMLTYLRDLFERRQTELVGRIRDEERLALAPTLIAELKVRIKNLAPAKQGGYDRGFEGPPEIAVENVVADLVSMTPEKLNQKMGPAFVDSVNRYVRLFDIPLVRRLPIIRDLVALRSRGPGEVASAAANQTGRLLQDLVNIGTYFADLRGTVSPPIFVHRLGTTIVKATQGPTKRLLILAIVFVIVYGLSILMPLPEFLDSWFTRFFRPLTGFVAILGGLCAIPMIMGLWLRRIATQASESGTRIVEAQFLSHTKLLKTSRRREDSDLLLQRVIVPELRLRASDDLSAGNAMPELRSVEPNDEMCQRSYHDREVRFIRIVDVLYTDFLDGSPFHTSDRKTANQLIGNLALANLRHSDRQSQRTDRRTVEMLDLGRTTGMLTGPHMWFNYINRLLEQEIAKLLLDYNSNVQPIERLAMLPTDERERFRNWLASRSNKDPSKVNLPPPDVPNGVNHEIPDTPRRSTPPLLESVQFSAIDFLVEDEERESALEAHFGREVMELYRADRQELVRKVFRTYPLDRIPKKQRTINPYGLYQKYCANGKIALLPIRLLLWAVGQLFASIPKLIGVIREVLNPTLADPTSMPDSYDAAVRKIYRMRKPMFLASLWLRARFDVNYLGLKLPGVPGYSDAVPLIERDLDFIGAMHSDRLLAERLRLEHIHRLRWLQRTLIAVGIDYESLEERCRRDFPKLVERRAEIIRALTTAYLVDFDDIRSLSSSIFGIKEVMEYASDSRSDFERMPSDLPPAASPVSMRWRPGNRSWLDSFFGSRKIFKLPCFPEYDLWEQRRIRQYIYRHRSVAGGWVDVLISQGGADPLKILEQRMLDIVRRVDLWSDELVTLRSVQTLTLLDIDHYCRLVWQMGRYEELGDQQPNSLAWPEDMSLTSPTVVANR